jgi:hypothetical protein
VKNTRVAGHGLHAEGKPFTWSERSGRYVRVYPAYEKEGQGLCECGEVSAVLTTDAGRKRWHQAHKEGFVTQDDEMAAVQAGEDAK